MTVTGYELVALLGEGGMGCVYRAVHRPSGRVVAVKTIHAELKRDPSRRRLLLDEATAAAKLDDPRVVRLYDVGREPDGSPFLVMELAEGVPLDEAIARWIGWPAIARALVSTLEGLAAAHARGIVHRDLKPGNVIVAPDGTARVLDFGVAAMLDPFAEARSRTLMGTPEFMAPEQLTTDGAIGPWTDLYAFGVMLARVVRGSSPFEAAETMIALLLEKQQHVPAPDPPAREGLAVPAALQALIERLIRPHHRARPRFAAEVARELAALMDRVEDHVEAREGPLEEADSIQPTTVEPVGSSLNDGAGAVIERSPPLELPAWLPAGVADPALGAALSQLREVPLVGRDAERAELEAVVDAVVRDRTPRLVLYVGEPGIGKSHLARWGLAHVERTGRMEGAAGAYDPSGADVAGGLRHALRRLVGAPGAKPERTWGWIDEPELDPVELARYLGDEDRTTLLPVESVVRMAHAVLRGVGRVHPIYLWLDDLAWARDGALQLVEALLDAGDAPVLVVATMRAGSTEHPLVRSRFERLAEHPRATRRELSVLDDAARAALIRRVAPVGAALAAEIAERVDGSPFLLVQLALDWLARGLLVARGATYGARDGASVDALLVDRPLTALVDDRLAAVLASFGPAPALEVLGRAALLGSRFEVDALRAACATDPRLEAALDRVLDHALLVGLLRAESSGVYSFDHGLVHEALVQRVERGPMRQRALLDAADALLARYGRDRVDVAGLVADLCRRAGDLDRAWERLLHAINRAAWAADAFGATRYLETARAWLAEDPERLADVEHAEAQALYFELRYDEAMAALARARAAARTDEQRLTFDATEADVLFYTDRFREAQALAERCLAAAADSDDPAVLTVAARAAHRLADLAGMRGDMDEELVHRESCVACYEPTHQHWRIRTARLNVASVLSALGRVDEALALAEAVLDEATRHQDDVFVGTAHETRAQVLALAGRGREVRDVIEANRALALARGDRWRLTMASAYAALVAAELDDEATMVGEARRFVDAYRAVPHDETATIAALLRLAGRLEARGQEALAREVDGLLDARIARVAVGFAEEAS